MTTFTDRYERIRAVITFCDKCGCDLLDNGLHPVSCPYCTIRELRAERDRLAAENAGLREAAKSARDALAVAIKAAWEGSTDASASSAYPSISTYHAAASRTRIGKV